MIVQLKGDNKTIDFISGGAELNENDDFIQTLDVIPEIPLTAREKLLVIFESVEARRTYKIELLQKNDMYSIDIPQALIESGGEFSFLLLRRRYDTSGENYTETGSYKYYATIGEGIINTNGQKVTVAMITTLYRAVEAAINDTVPYIIQTAQEAATSAENSKDAADLAVAAAIRAEVNTSNAAIRAEKAYAKAEEAIEKAEDAYAKASDALEFSEINEQTANEAKTIATQAKTNAATALEAANTSVSKLGDTMTGPLYLDAVDESGTTHRVIITPSSFSPSLRIEEVNETTGKSLKTVYGNGQVYYYPLNGGLAILNFPEQSGTIATEDASRTIAQEEIAKFDFIKIVAELPEEGLPNRFYLVPKTDGSSSDLFDAWTWVNKGTEEEPAYGWEYEGTKSAEFDPTLFVKFTDYAGTNNELGVVSLNANFGITSYRNELYKNALSIQPATFAQMEAKTSLYHPITPARGDHFVKVGVTTNTETLTDEDQTKACAWLGAVAQSTVSPNEAKVWTIPQRTYNGRVIVGTPEEKNDATTKAYVDEGFVAKLGAGDGWRVYAVLADGSETSFPIVNDVKEATIPWRGVGGVVKVGTPLAPEDATHKKFVENLPDYLTLTDDERAKWLSMLGATKLYKQTISIQPSGDWENYDRLIVTSSKKDPITDLLDLSKEIMGHSAYVAYDDGTAYHKIISIFDGFECVVCVRSENGFALESLDISAILGYVWTADIVSVEEI